MAESLDRLQRFTQTARAWLFNFKMGLAILVFTPLDASMIYGRVELPGLGHSFWAWLGLLVLSQGLLWRGAPRARQAWVQERNGETEAEARDSSELFFVSGAALLGVFLALLYGVDSKTPQAWDLGFLAAGLALMALALFRLVRYLRPASE